MAMRTGPIIGLGTRERERRPDRIGNEVRPCSVRHDLLRQGSLFEVPRFSPKHCRHRQVYLQVYLCKTSRHYHTHDGPWILSLATGTRWRPLRAPSPNLK